MSKLSQLLNAKRANQQNTPAPESSGKLTSLLKTPPPSVEEHPAPLDFSQTTSNDTTEYSASSSQPSGLSKLAALAAQKKNQNSEEASNKRPLPSSSSSSLQPDTKSNDSFDKEQLLQRFRKVRIAESKTPSEELDHDTLSRYPAPPEEQVNNINYDPSSSELPQYDLSSSSPTSMMAAPSIFARCLTGAKKKAMQKEIKVNLKRSSILGFNAPSPDDLVLMAQSKSKGFQKYNRKDRALFNSLQQLKNASLQRTSTSIATPTVTKDVMVDKSKLLELSKDIKPTNRISIFGAPKVGKKTLLARLLYQVGALDIKLMQRCTLLNSRKENLSSVLGRNESGLYQFETFSHNYLSSLFALPLHDLAALATFLQTTDIAVIVIHAKYPLDEIESIVCLLRLFYGVTIKNVLFVVTQMDQISWEEEQYQYVVSSVITCLKETYSITVPWSSFLPVSGFRGDNLTTLSYGTLQSWYDDETLLGKIDELSDKSIDEKLQLQHLPLSLTITSWSLLPENKIAAQFDVHSGIVQAYQKIYTSVGKLEARVQSLKLHQHARTWCLPGEHTEMHLSSLPNLMNGTLCIDVENSYHLSRIAYISAFTFDSSLKVHSPIYVNAFFGAFSMNAKVFFYSEGKENTMALQGLQFQNKNLFLIRLELDQPIPLVEFNTVPSLSRVLLLSKEAKTLWASGIIISVQK
ncbi:ski complex interacting GTPase [Schizosaccharomyces cryophilus OY26]|uniref:Ski complex interacting GTPase n=1 Tax=Schizosaccharomyces cryophilus (strain OY26 / ATCC MYA-4695 / CBS 11777 / NBRC 106824 / NRRL Y48691) TaxID=653667 RepID=S9W5G3_SCHCR|nr:ski complex interacting GTPase [Schizosaccharomyces cryophilus OY26]EPY53185.1 ski complex interacting GTPase [Schizosaccharomyces cryophilus OY26]